MSELEHKPDFQPSFQCEHPPFWAGDVDIVYGEVEKAKLGEVVQIATSPGGRPIYLVSYSEKEHFPSKANFNSAVGSRDMTAFADKSSRTRPVVFLLGPVHGEETTGSTACVNLIHIMETGADLRGQEHPELRKLAESCRVLVVPIANPDGLARCRTGCFVGCKPYEVRYWSQGTYADGRLCKWPDCKAQHPMRGGNVGVLGCYFNDDGVNIMHDEFFRPMATATEAILNLARAEAPEVVVSFHAHPTPLAVLQPAHVPMYIKREAAELARLLKEALQHAGLAFAESFTPAPDGETPPGSPFNLVSALFHVSGALSVTLECPVGMAGGQSLQCTHEEILDMQLVFFGQCFEFARKRLNVWPGSVC